ncbi:MULTISPECIES: ROK family protein [unclassified Streptomyces]|uniref:ROK family protein n=1 Tax=unclassified Streptomyces TaxID=2593676 RepID=UPI0035D7269D
MTQWTLAVDIGGTSISAGVVDPGQRVRARRRIPTSAEDGAQQVLDRALRLVREIRDEATRTGLPAPTALGIGTAGVVDGAGRTVTHATSALPGWAGTPVSRLAEDRLGLPVALLGDVQAFLVGETTSVGAAAHASSALGVMAGTGIGGALRVNGALVRGERGAAGHLGHVPVPQAAGLTCPCGAEGHVEALASGPAMTAHLATELPGARIESLRDVSRLAHDGEPAARRVLSLGGAALGTALAGVVATTDPYCVVISGGVLSSGPWYLDALRGALAGQTLPALADVPVRTSLLGADAVLVGAAETARAPATAR